MIAKRKLMLSQKLAHNLDAKLAPSPNRAERDFCAQYDPLPELAGSSIYRGGWPDYYLWMENMAVEVKRGKKDELTELQRYMFNVFTRHGMRCAVWTPGGGLDEVPQIYPAEAVRELCVSHLKANPHLSEAYQAWFARHDPNP